MQVATDDGSAADATSADGASDGSKGCTLGAVQCSDAGVQTCNANGQWGGTGACPVSLPFCNGAGGCGVCSSGTTKCSSGNSVQTCGPDGTWGPPWSCSTGSCTAGACASSTTSGTSCLPGGPGMDNCGPGGFGTESCCTSLEVTGGTYYRTYDPLDAGVPVLAADGGAAHEVDPATVSSFRLDKYLVTVGRFRQYIQYLTGSTGAPPVPGSGIHTHLNGGLGLANVIPGTYETGWDATAWSPYIATGSGAADVWNASLSSCNILSHDDAGNPYVAETLSTWTTTPGARENLPIGCVNWYEACAFCIWDGGFLPSEAEWGYAAAGGSQQREYPWGSTDPGTASQYAIYGDNVDNCYYPTGTLQPCTVASIAPVGTPSLGAGYWGQLDMAGEMSEWVLDWYAAYVDTYVVPCIDCANLSPGQRSKVIRTGSGPKWELLAPQRGSLYLQNHDQFMGFRCARAP